MSRKEYEIDTDLMKAVPKRSFWSKTKPFILSMITGVIFGLLFVWFFSNKVGTPNERLLKEQIADYKFKYRIINDKLADMQVVLDELQNRDDNVYRLIFEAEPVSSKIRNTNLIGNDKYEQLVNKDKDKLIESTLDKLNLVASKIVVQSSSYDEVFKLAQNKDKMIASIPAIQPVANTNLMLIASYFGSRTDPFYKISKFHEGMDFAASQGTPVYATGDGKVVHASYNNGGYGNLVKIDHGFNYQTVYAHLHKINVRLGSTVKRGEVIGTVGNTGKSTGPHLHYEVRKDNIAVNPLYFFFNDITVEEYQKMVELAKLPSQTMD